MRTVALVYLLLWAALVRAGDPVSIGLFRGNLPVRATVLVDKGSYAVYAGDQLLLTLKAGQSADFSAATGSLTIQQGDRTYSGYGRLKMDATDFAECRIHPAGQKASGYIYTHDLLLTATGGRIQFVNRLDVEDYIPGVIEAEGGSRHELEYYKVQAIISRTYALNNLRRHEAEGYHLCDGTHCQVYHGRPRHEPQAARATEATRDIVIVDDQINLITAAFHSNCGGHTINAEDVWSKPLSYCVGRPDTFCLVMPHSNWEKTIPLKQWTDYLSSKRYPVNEEDTTGANALAYFPSEKQVYFVDDSFRIPLRTIREDLKLRSTFFTVHQEGEEVTFIGQGFGHGVGLCQEGAIRMAQLGFGYEEIIHYYYTNVHLVPRRFIWFFKED